MDRCLVIIKSQNEEVIKNGKRLYYNYRDGVLFWS